MDKVISMNDYLQRKGRDINVSRDQAIAAWKDEQAKDYDQQIEDVALRMQGIFKKPVKGD